MFIIIVLCIFSLFFFVESADYVQKRMREQNTDEERIIFSTCITTYRNIILKWNKHNQLNQKPFIHRTGAVRNGLFNKTTEFLFLLLKENRF